MTDRTINGMTVEDIRAFCLPKTPYLRNDLENKLCGIVLALLDALEAGQAEAQDAKQEKDRACAESERLAIADQKMLGQYQARAEGAEALLKDALDRAEMAEADNADLVRSYGEDVSQRSRERNEAIARAERAEAQVAEMRAALEGCMLEIAHSDEPGALDGCPGCESLFRAKAALSSSSGNKALAVIEAAKTLHRIGMNRDGGDGAAFMEASAQMGRALAEFEGGEK